MNPTQHRWLAVAGIAIALIGATPLQATACSCTYEPNFDRDFAFSDFVFRGTVLSIEPAPSVFVQSILVRIEVNGRWKGEIPAVARVVTGENAGVCGLGFEVGTEYLVYAFDTSDPAIFFTHSCWRTHATYEGDPDIVALGPVPVRPMTWGAIKALYRD